MSASLAGVLSVVVRDKLLSHIQLVPPAEGLSSIPLEPIEALAVVSMM